jgi:CBS domain-containing protein
LLGWFNAQRRRPNVVETIRLALGELELATVPDFEEQFFDQRVVFQSQADDVEPDGEVKIDAPEKTKTPKPIDNDVSTVDTDEMENVFDDETTPEDSGQPVTLRIVDEPTYQVSHLPTASKQVLSVKPDTTIVAATTEMLYRNFDQMPVMTGPRDVKGIITWKGIGRARASGKSVERVSDCMEPAHEIALHESMFEAVRLIQRFKCVLVKDRSKQVCGIVTGYDITRTFNDLAEPFLLIGEIENLIRNLIAANFELKDIQTVQREGDKPILSVSDMTFGQYLFLLQPDDNWRKMPLEIDKAFFINKLDEVRQARNDVMHFEPEGVEPDKLKVLREFANFLHQFA